MKSMTGYGSVERVFKEGRLSIELKALNSRFFELHFKTPREFSFFESKSAEELKKIFKRGSFDLFVSWQPENRVTGRYELNRSLLKYYLKTALSVQRDLKIPGTLLIDRALSLPDIWKSSSKSFGTSLGGSLSRDIYWKMFYPALKRCIDLVEKMRNREGIVLHKVLRKHLSDLKKEAGALTDLRDRWIQSYETRLQERIRTYLNDKAFDSGRLHQEAAVLISRTDIHEELDRLASHVAQCFSTINSKGEIGKKFDFLLQEMNREVNTIGSKTQDFSISSSVIRMKSLIEKLREQIQNVE